MKTNQLLLYALITILCAFATFILHEMAHWIAYELLGYDAGFRLNYASIKDKSVEISNTEKIISSGAGPLFTLIQAAVIFYILKAKNKIFLYPFLFLPFIMRLGAMWANQFAPNDEGRISLLLGLNLYVVSTIVVLVHLILVILISKKNKYSFKFNLFNFLTSSIAISLIVYLDNILRFEFV